MSKGMDRKKETKKKAAKTKEEKRAAKAEKAARLKKPQGSADRCARVAFSRRRPSCLASSSSWR
jgi:hypothetical protein